MRSARASLNATVFLLLACLGQTAVATATTAQTSPAVAYRVFWPEPASHYFHVEMTVAPAPGDQLLVRLPSWRPGRYIMQEFARNVVGVTVSSDEGSSLLFHKTDKNTWSIDTNGSNSVIVKYKVYSAVLDGGNSYLDESEAYLNPVSLLMYVPGWELQPVTMELPVIEGWTAATALERDGKSGPFLAPTYHDLVDSPIIVSPDLDVFSFDLDGVRYEIVFQGKGNYDPDRIIDGVRRVVRVQTRLAGHVPFSRYVFLYHLVDKRIGHGVEHKNSTSIVLGRMDFEKDSDYRGFFGITAHEFFHAWNVERIRPAVIYHPDYGSEQYTGTMWWYEGVTSYYAAVTAARAGFTDDDGFLSRMASAIGSYKDDPATTVTSVAMTSHDSWIKSAGAPPSTFHSFYASGQVLGFLLDLEIRARTKNDRSLDDVVRYLYREFAQQDRGVPEDGIQAAVEKVAGGSFSEFFQAHIYDTLPIDHDRYLRHAGLALRTIREIDSTSTHAGIELVGDGPMATIRSVLEDSPAKAAGLHSGDIVVALDSTAISVWGFDRAVTRYEPGAVVHVMIIRAGAVLTVPMTLAGRPLETKRYILESVSDPTELQLRIRRSLSASD